MIANLAAALGAAKAITTQWTFRWDIFETNPDTGAPWLPSDAAAAKIAIQRVA
jgi:hypothetical protein